jgi:hypothetical protein
MSRDKQIEEMAIELSKVNCKPKGCGYCYLEYGTLENSCEEYLFYKKMAIALYNEGYRKAEDVAEEIFAEIDDFQRTLRHIFLDMCDGNDYNTLNLLQIDSAIEALFDSRIAELKKKYTQGKAEIPPYVRMEAKALPATLNVKYTEEGQ